MLRAEEDDRNEINILQNDNVCVDQAKNSVASENVEKPETNDPTETFTFTSPKRMEELICMFGGRSRGFLIKRSPNKKVTNSLDNEIRVSISEIDKDIYQKVESSRLENNDKILGTVSEEVPYVEQWNMNNVSSGNGHGDLNTDFSSYDSQQGCWTIGLINSKLRYLTAEMFGFKVNADGFSLRKKQIWILETSSSYELDSTVCLRSHLNKYLAVDLFGNVTCESDENELTNKFQITIAEDGTGRWAFKNVVTGFYLGSSSNRLTCSARVPGGEEFWYVHLVARPYVNLRSVGRKRLARLSHDLHEIYVDANISREEDTLFTLEFHVDNPGKYALRASNNKCLSHDGKLLDQCKPDCLFFLEYHGGQLALRDQNGAYLSPIGPKAVLKTRSTIVTKDELFSLEDPLLLVSFLAALNNRYVSVKQGVDATANQEEISDDEIFQLEFDTTTKRWYIRTLQDQHWTLETGGGIQASGNRRSTKALFDLVWQPDGSVKFCADNNKYVSTKGSGNLYANCDSVDDESTKYFFYLINRPILALKCEQGFVGYNTGFSSKLVCNKVSYEPIYVERGKKGMIFFKGKNEKYWQVDGESFAINSDTPEGFFLELREPTRICIKTTSGEYFVAGKNGAFHLGDSNYDKATKWEY